MKKVLLIGLILVICVLAFPQGVMADLSSAAVNANIVQSLSFGATGPGGVWDLQAGPATTTTTTDAQGIKFDVTSNGAWNVNVKSATNTGHMKPLYDESGAQALNKVLQIQNLNNVGYQDVTSTVDILAELKTPDTGMTYYKGLSQETIFSDARLMTSGNHYTITLEFECVQNA
jgi:hypothetical protein